MPFYRKRRHRFKPNVRPAQAQPRLARRSRTAPIPQSEFNQPVRSVQRSNSSAHVVDYQGMHVMNDLQYYRHYKTTQPQTFQSMRVSVDFDAVVRALPTGEPRLTFAAPRAGLYTFQIDIALSDNLNALNIKLVCTPTEETIWETTQLAFTGNNSMQAMVFLDEGTRWHVALEKPGNAPNATYIAKVQCVLDKAWSA